MCVGMNFTRRLQEWATDLVLVPPFLEDSGALGGILSSRLASKLHLGVIDPVAVPQRPARRDFLLTFCFAVPKVQFSITQP